MKRTNHFETYLSTHFTRERDPEATRAFCDLNYLAYLPADRSVRILDIGCGTGEFILYLRSKGYANACGVDISEEAVEFCKKNGVKDVSAIKDIMEYLSENRDSFSAITLNDTIEHFRKDDIVPILAAIKSSLKRGGCLILRTGNASTLGGLFLRYKDFTHEVGFTEYSLKQVLRLAGFENIVIFGNRYPVRANVRSMARAVLLRMWFCFLGFIYLIESGEDRPRILSKLLIAIARD